MELVKILFCVFWLLSLAGGLYFNRASRDSLGAFGVIWILVTLLGATVYFGWK